MKLYFSPGACSLSPHIVLRETGMKFDLEQVNNQEKKTKSGVDYWSVNGKGQVPVLEFDNGDRLTEGPVIVQYIADQVPDKKLAPAYGTIDRYRVQEWLNYITSELHKNIGMLFNPALPEEGKVVIRARAKSRLQWMDAQLAGKSYLMGDEFSIADPYLFTIARWTRLTGVDTTEMKNLQAFAARMASRPSVLAAMKAEDLPT